MTHDLTPDDTTALRRQGDWHLYLRGLIRPTRPHTPARDGPTTTYGPTHQPGAWPHGTHPPTSTVCQPDCDCAIRPPPNTPHHPNGSAPT